MMLERERRKLLAVPLCGPRVVERLESIRVTALADLADRDPEELVFAVNVAAGRPIWRRPMAHRAMANLIAAAQPNCAARAATTPAPPSPTGRA